MTDKTKTAPSDNIADTLANEDARKAGVPNAVWMGTAVGVGSAALVAALMYASRRTKKG